MHISRSEIKFVRNYSIFSVSHLRAYWLGRGCIKITEFSELLMTERFDIICFVTAKLTIHLIQ
jgi:hypothetical protein